MESKKSRHADIERKRPVFFQIGLVTALSIALLAFEWKTFYEPEPIVADETIYVPDDVDIVITRRKIEKPKPKPEPPKARTPEISTEPLVEPEPDPDPPKEPLEVPEDASLKMIELPPEDPGVTDKIFVRVESMPHACKCAGVSDEIEREQCSDRALMASLAKNTRYPKQARDAGIEGVVWVYFVIGKDGAIEDSKIIKSVHSLLDNEALRVVRNLSCFIPGKQRLKPVRVSYRLPIRFTLG